MVGNLLTINARLYWLAPTNLPPGDYVLFEKDVQSRFPLPVSVPDLKCYTTNPVG